MKKKIFICKLFVVLLLSCTPQRQKDECLILKVQLEDKGTSFDELFEKIELIPLELNDSSFIKDIKKLELIDDTLYLFDRELKSLHIFDGVSGRHLNTIMKVGQGPEEYLYVYDVIVDTSERVIS